MSCLILANLGQAWARYMRNSLSLESNWTWLVAFVSIALLWIGLFFWDKHSRPARSPAARAGSLFIELCETHGLTPQQRSSLLAATKKDHLAEPAVVFIDPRIVGRLAESESNDTGAYAALHQRLFGEIAAADGGQNQPGI